MGLKLESNRRFSEFSTFGIGGPIRHFAEISKIEEMEDAFRFAREMGLPKLILGKGSNCLFSDEGFDGLVLLNKIDGCDFQSNEVVVGSGYSFSLLGVQSARRGLSGLEFASGIPASVGGAVFMNAGANGRQTADSLKSVLYLHEDGRREIFNRGDLHFSYRHSPFQKMQGAILNATFLLTPLETARKSQLEIIDYRMKTQPLKEKSAGCIFCNPPGASAGALIDQCGLKGMQVGGAQVSEIHANFLINAKNATAQDMKELIQLVQKKVAEKTGIELELEVRYLP